MSTNKVKQDKLAPPPCFPDIIIAMELLDPNPSAPRFHWSPFVQDPESTQASKLGTKLHATDPGGYWEFEHVKFSLIESASVVVAVIVGTLPAADKEKEPRFSCRVWVREALRHLHANGYINCPDVDAMEREMMEYAKPAISSINDESFSLAALYIAVNSK